MWEILESFLIIAVVSGGLIAYALVLAVRKDREAGSSSKRVKLHEFVPGERAARRKATGTAEVRDPDAHVGHTGTE